MIVNWNGVPGLPTEVYSIDGHLVGTVTEAWPEDYASTSRLARALNQTGSGYFRLGGFKNQDLYVPLNAVADYAEERLRLKVTRKQLGQQGWEERPAGLPK